MRPTDRRLYSVPNPKGSNGNGGGSEIESRLSALEAHMEHVATKHIVAIWVGGTAIVNFLILLGHLALRTIGS